MVIAVQTESKLSIEKMTTTDALMSHLTAL